MTKILVIGAGGVGSVATHKMAMLQDVFSDITLASRREVKCKDIADSVMARVGRQIQTAELDADDTNATARLIEKTGAELVVNLSTSLSGFNHHGGVPESRRALSGYSEL